MNEPDFTPNTATYLLATDRQGVVLSHSGNLHQLAVDTNGGPQGQHWRNLFAGYQEVRNAAIDGIARFAFLPIAPALPSYRVAVYEARPGSEAPDSFVIIEESAPGTEAVSVLSQRQKTIALGQLAAEVAHEVNNPLATICGWIQFLVEEMDESDAMRGTLLMLHEEARRVAELVGNLLQFSRPSGDSETAVDVNSTVELVLSLVDHSLTLSNIQISVGLADALPLARVNDDHLRQACLNIILNAKDAMPEGGALSIETTLQDDRIQLEFRDTGPGIPRELLGKILDPFFTTRRDRGGTGLGLFVTRTVVERHGGSLEVESERGKGAAFRIKLLPA